MRTLNRKSRVQVCSVSSHSWTELRLPLLLQLLLIPLLRTIILINICVSSSIVCWFGTLERDLPEPGATASALFCTSGHSLMLWSSLWPRPLIPRALRRQHERGISHSFLDVIIMKVWRGVVRRKIWEKAFGVNFHPLHTPSTVF